MRENIKKPVLHGTGMVERFEKQEALHGIDVYTEIFITKNSV